MARASDYFREMVGDRVLMYNPAARALYETLRGWEDHHGSVHKDCEDAMTERLRAAIAAVYPRPLGISSPANTEDTQDSVS